MAKKALRQEVEKTKPRKTPEPRAPSLLPPLLLSPYHTPTQPSHDTSNGGAEHGKEWPQQLRWPRQMAASVSRAASVKLSRRGEAVVEERQWSEERQWWRRDSMPYGGGVTVRRITYHGHRRGEKGRKG